MNNSNYLFYLCLLILVLFFTSCNQRFDSYKYHEHESQAINDVLYDPEEWEEYELELKLFDKLINKKIKPRKANIVFNSRFEINTFSRRASTNYHTKPNELGYLIPSRVLFNYNFTKGYTSFIYFCGEACVWDKNIEIKKKNGKWYISREFSGGIS